MRFKSHLKKLAKKSPHIRYLHGAVVARGKSILGVGFNSSRYHAERAAILAASADLHGATLYTLMIRKRTNTLGEGAPCFHCMQLIQNVGIKRVVVYV